MIDLHSLHIGSSLWYQGKECKVTVIKKVSDPNADFPKRKVTWTISLTDVLSYQEEFDEDRSNNKLDPNRGYVYTGEVEWDSIKHDCVISNAIDFIRETT